MRLFLFGFVFFCLGINVYLYNTPIPPDDDWSLWMDDTSGTHSATLAQKFFENEYSFDKHDDLLQNNKYTKIKVFTGRRKSDNVSVVIKIMSHHQSDTEMGINKALGNHKGFPIVLDTIKMHNKTAVIYKRILLDPDNHGKPVSCTHLRLYMHQLMQRFATIQASNLVHSDMKASNVLLDKDNLLWMIDFGQSYFAYTHDDIWAYCPDMDHNNRRCWGTAEYWPPELNATMQGDMWASGVIMIYLMLGSWAEHNMNWGRNFEVPQCQNFQELRRLARKKHKHLRKDEEGHYYWDPLGWRLAQRLLEPDPAKRPLAKDLLNDPYFHVLDNEQCHGKRYELVQLPAFAIDPKHTPSPAPLSYAPGWRVWARFYVPPLSLGAFAGILVVTLVGLVTGTCPEGWLPNLGDLRSIGHCCKRVTRLKLPSLQLPSWPKKATRKRPHKREFEA